MRKIENHKVAGSFNDNIAINVIDPAGEGGASHCYDVVLPNGKVTRIEFQNGPIKASGVNGLTQEALLAIVIDRLRCFQAGPYACEENGTALGFAEEALGVLQDRTKARMDRGVEGTRTV